MAVFLAPDDKVDDWGRRLAQLPQVSHCYRRRPLADFNYNLFAMTHGESPGQVLAVLDRAAADLGARDYSILFSCRQYKKTSMRYFRQ